MSLLKRKSTPQWGVFGEHLGPLFSGSKSECLKFLAYVMSQERKSYRVAPV